MFVNEKIVLKFQNQPNNRTFAQAWWQQSRTRKRKKKFGYIQSRFVRMVAFFNQLSGRCEQCHEKVLNKVVKEGVDLQVSIYNDFKIVPCCKQNIASGNHH